MPQRGSRFRRATPTQVLEEIAPAIVRSLDADEIVDTVAELTRRVIDYDNFRLYRWDRASESLVLAKSVARSEPYTNEEWLKAAQRIGLGQGVTGHAAKTRQTVVVSDATHDSRIYYAPGAQRLAESVLCVPMVAGDELIGVMSLSKLGAGTLSAGDRGLMEAVAAQTALALVNADRYAEAERTIMALAALDQAQREFVLIASHELRTPLAVITGYASMLGDGSLGQLPPPVADAVAVMAAKLAEMGSLVERMLHVARIDEGLEAVRSDRVDMAQAAREAVERIRAAVDFRQGRIALEAPAEPALAEADPQAVALVFDNLLQNATKFTLAPPDIRIRLSNGDGVRLEVADSGVGIPADAQARLFEKFFRADHPELRHVGGTGLGLYLVKRLVEAMGGSISFISTPGEGTTFVVALKPASTAALAIPDC